MSKRVPEQLDQILDKIDPKIVKKGISVLFLILIIEFAFFGVFYVSQPSTSAIVSDHVLAHQDKSGGFKESMNNPVISLDASFYALSILHTLNRSDQINQETLLQFVSANYDNTTGLFFKEPGELSLRITYSAVGILKLLGKLNTINTTKTITSVLALKTTNSLFYDYDELGTIYQDIGELDHSFEAISILEKLYTNTTEFYLAVNRTELAKGLISLQQADGGFRENIIESTVDMKNVYKSVSTMSKLNTSIKFFENLGFDSLGLKQWIERMYTEDGFRMQSYSQPSSEATAYAIITLRRLGVNATEIYARFGKAINSMLEALNDDLLENEIYADTIDKIHDITFSLKTLDSIQRLEGSYVSEKASFIGLSTLGATILLIILFSLLNVVFIFKEEDKGYFEYDLMLALKQSSASNFEDFSMFSDLLQVEIDSSIVYPLNESLLSIRLLLLNDFELIIEFDQNFMTPRKFIAIKKGSSMPTLTLDFNEAKLTSEVVQELKELKNK